MKFELMISATTTPNTVSMATDTIVKSTVCPSALMKVPSFHQAAVIVEPNVPHRPHAAEAGIGEAEAERLEQRVDRHEQHHQDTRGDQEPGKALTRIHPPGARDVAERPGF